jgi:hypothetical protein
MTPILVYAPALIALPFLLIGGIFFIVIPGGFIIVLGLLFYAATAFVGMVGAAGRTRRDARHASRRAAARAAAPARPASRQPVGSAPVVALNRAQSGTVAGVAARRRAA